MPNQTPPPNSRRPVAYLNQKFLGSPDARALRILAEFLEPLAHFRREKVRDTVVFFGSARLREDGPLAQYYNDARTLARLLTEWSEQFTGSHHRFVVCSGGGPGIMEAANRGADDIGAKSVGLNIALPMEQVPNAYITPDLCFQFRYFAIRKFHFVLRAMALVVFPGGFGTIDELFEVLTLRQTGRMQHIPVIMVGRDYWSRAINFDFLADEGVVLDEDLKLFEFVDTAEAAWKIIREFHKL
jgi:uncharacterized protein (TIGR00730 family)